MTTWVYLLKEKSKAGQTFKQFHAMVKTQFQSDIRVLCTDNETEYFNSILGNYLSQEGIVHQNSCTGTPQQNRVAERKNRHLLKVARAIMFTTNVPNIYWEEAILTATYLINRMPTRVLRFKTPISVFL